MKKLLIPLVAVVPAVVLGVAGAAEAATPAVSISRIYFNSPGTDDRSNASLNAEYLRLTNNTAKAVQLKGFTVRDKANHVYTFKVSTSLGSKQSIYLHTGKGTDTKPNGPDRYWQSGNYIWNNTGDTATLKNAAAKVVDTCTYTSKSGSATNC